jgi:aquaporin Z
MADSPNSPRASTFGAPDGKTPRPRRIATTRRSAAEVIGTFWLVLGGWALQ